MRFFVLLTLFYGSEFALIPVLQALLNLSVDPYVGVADIAKKIVNGVTLKVRNVGGGHSEIKKQQPFLVKKFYNRLFLQIRSPFLFQASEIHVYVVLFFAWSCGLRQLFHSVVCLFWWRHTTIVG